MKRNLIVCALLIAAAAAFGASEYFTKGESLFVDNKPKEARPLLESSLQDDPNNEKAYLYLGIIYQQMGDAQKAIDVLKKGLAISSQYTDLFYYNIANNYFARKEFGPAEEAYTSALAANKDLAGCYLNRANTRLQLKNIDGALADYTLFLQMAPQDPQRPNIEKVMALLQKVLGEQEQARQAELARQKALMDEVNNSLSTAGDATKNLSVESINGQTEAVDVDIKD